MSGGQALLIRLALLLAILLGVTLALLSVVATIEPRQPSVLIDAVPASATAGIPRVVPTLADWEQCVRVDPGPIKPRTRPVLNPHQSEIV